MGDYTFGDTDLASERLQILDAVFASTSDALLDLIDDSPARVADLGCGPGATTARLVRRFPSGTAGASLYAGRLITPHLRSNSRSKT